MLSDRTLGQQRFQGTRKDWYGKATGKIALGLVSGGGRGKPMPKTTTYPAGRQLPKSEENGKCTFTTRKPQTSASIQNEIKHSPQQQTPNPITA